MLLLKRRYLISSTGRAFGITFMRHAKKNIGKPNNSEIFGSKKPKGHGEDINSRLMVAYVRDRGILIVIKLTLFRNWE